MIKAVVLSAFAILSPVAAFAGNYGEHPPQAPAPTATSASMSSSRSHSTSRSAATSSSVSAPVINVTNQVTTPPGSTRHSSGGSHSSGSSSGGQVVPGGGGIMAAPIIEGGNNCAEGASAGANHWFTGAFFSWMGENHECSLRQTAAILANMRLEKQAIEVLCRTNMDVRWAMRNSRTPCQDDVERWEKDQRKVR